MFFRCPRKQMGNGRAQGQPSGTFTGSLESLIVPIPSAPDPLPPQHQSVPSLLRAQVCTPPALISATPVPSAVFRTAVGMCILEVAVPTPSCPLPLPPQHQTLPSLLRAHVWRYPVLTSATSEPRQTTGPGKDR